jgi:hypothetical protein
MAIGETTIKIRRDTAANWTTKNPILAQGEMGFETDTGYLKIGTGSLNWEDLDYFTGPVDTTITTATATDLDGLLAGDGSTVYSLPLTTYQPLDSDLTAIAALSTTSFGRALLTLASAAAGRSALELGSASLLDAANVALLNAANTFSTGPQVFVGGATVNSGSGADSGLTVQPPSGVDVDGIFRVMHSNGQVAFAVNTSGYLTRFGPSMVMIDGSVGNFTTRPNGDIRADSFQSFTVTNPSLRWPSATPDITAGRTAAGQLRLSRLGTDGSSSVLSFAGPSSLGTVRDVGVITSGFATATDASFQGQLSLGVYGIVGGTDTLQTGLTILATSAGTPLVLVGGTTATASDVGFRKNSGRLQVVLGDLSDVAEIEVKKLVSLSGSHEWYTNATGWQSTTAAGAAFASITGSYVRPMPVTVAALPSAASAGRGAIAYVTDANSTTRRAIAVGGGSNEGPVHSDGTNWLIT